jgi:hypothetical protein
MWYRATQMQNNNKSDVKCVIMSRGAGKSRIDIVELIKNHVGPYKTTSQQQATFPSTALVLTGISCHGDRGRTNAAVIKFPSCNISPTSADKKQQQLMLGGRRGSYKMALKRIGDDALMAAADKVPIDNFDVVPLSGQSDDVSLPQPSPSDDDWTDTRLPLIGGDRIDDEYDWSAGNDVSQLPLLNDFAAVGQHLKIENIPPHQRQHNQIVKQEMRATHYRQGSRLARGQSRDHIEMDVMEHNRSQQKQEDGDGEMLGTATTATATATATAATTTPTATATSAATTTATTPTEFSDNITARRPPSVEQLVNVCEQV